MTSPRDDSVPEPDLLEQEAEVEPAGEVAPPSRDPEVPEADAWEQAQGLPEDDEDLVEPD